MLEELLHLERNAFFSLNGWHTPFLDQFIWLYTGKAVWIPAALLTLFTLCYKKDWRESALILLAIVLLITLCDQFASSVCKPLFSRFRPTRHPDFMHQVLTVYDYRGGLYGFISSHAANAFGFATFTILLFKHRLHTVAVLLWSLFMGYTRIYLGVHFISDIVAGLIAGVGIGFLCYRLYCYVRRQLWGHQIVPPEQLYTDGEKRLVPYGLMITVVLMAGYSWIAIR